MSRMKFIMIAVLITALPGLTGATLAQSNERPYRMNDSQVEKILHSVEKDAKTFRSSLDHTLDQSRLNSTGQEDEVNAFIKDFEAATKQLHERFDNRQSAAGDVQNVLDRASRIDEFMRRNPLDRRAQSDWSRMRGNLDRLASAYGVRWRWQQAYLPAETQSRPYRINDRDVERLLRRAEKAAKAFSHSLDRSLDSSRLDGTSREDDINQFVKEFEEATKQLRDRFDGRTSVAADVESVITRAARVDDFMGRHRLDRRTQSDWRKLRNELEHLARAYNVSWNWNNRTYRS